MQSHHSPKGNSLTLIEAISISLSLQTPKHFMYQLTPTSSDRITIALMIPAATAVDIGLIVSVIPHLLCTLDSHSHQRMNWATSSTMSTMSGIRTSIRPSHSLRQSTVKRCRGSLENSARDHGPPNAEIDENNEHFFHNSHQRVYQGGARDEAEPLAVVEDHE